MAIWLFARASGAPVPRRLVYVVDRRAVVDQATTEALNLREFVERDPELKQALGLSQALPISTLRGQHVDNRDWLGDPASPAVIVGTVDMIGSRLLFEGYGVSRKMRPFHAGLLGCDTLVILDESHLVPPFEELLKKIANPCGEFSARTDALRELVPDFKILALSATSRGGEQMFGLTEKDLTPGTVTHQRLTARKRLIFDGLGENETLPEALVRWAWQLTSEGMENYKIIVFSHSRDVARKAHDAVGLLAKGNKKTGISATEIHSQLLVGGRRVFEREEVAVWLEEHGLLSGSKLTPDRPTFVFATSAGEVGIDLDADHTVCDLVSWERMTQRLGRVNRRGEGNAKVIVVTEPEPKPSKAAENALKKSPEDRADKETKAIAAHEHKLQKARALNKPFELLPRDADGIDVSPTALRDLKLSSAPTSEAESSTDASERQHRREIIAAATSEEPLRPALTRALMDAWSMTSLREHTGRPRVQPWLRGWVDDDPQTTVLWRTFLPISPGGKGSPASVRLQIEAFFEAAPPHVSEMLETRTGEVIAWLKKRAESVSKISQSETKTPHLDADQRCAVVLARDGELRRMPLTIQDFLFSSDDPKGELFRLLAERTLVLDARVAGLNREGLLDEAFAEIPRTLDGPSDWLSAVDGKPAIPFRVRKANAGDETPVRDPNWRPRFTFPFESSLEEEPQSFLVVEKWGGEVETPDDATAPVEQRLDAHQSLAEQKAALLARRLGLPKEYAEMLGIAARLHDEGKSHDQWQDAFNAPRDHRPYAKTKGPINQALLNGYRHEFASVSAAAEDEAFRALPQDLQELGLHLIAAHHGFARPVITTRGYPDTPPSLLDARAREVAFRFARLQQQWGPWGLAWWESLLRAADQQASREIGPAR